MSYPISSSLLDGIVLAVVERESTYGYRITQDVQKVLDISESTLYPVLRRLMKDGCLTTYDQAYAGRNRRYYQITEHGRATRRCWPRCGSTASTGRTTAAGSTQSFLEG